MENCMIEEPAPYVDERDEELQRDQDEERPVDRCKCGGELIQYAQYFTPQPEAESEPTGEYFGECDICGWRDDDSQY